MTREELIELVRRTRPETLIAKRMYEALGLRVPSPSRRKGDVIYRQQAYKGAKRLMHQRHGVRL